MTGPPRGKHAPPLFSVKGQSQATTNNNFHSPVPSRGSLADASTGTGGGGSSGSAAAWPQTEDKRAVEVAPFLSQPRHFSEIKASVWNQQPSKAQVGDTFAITRVVAADPSSSSQSS